MSSTIRKLQYSLSCTNNVRTAGHNLLILIHKGLTAQQQQQSWRISTTAHKMYSTNEGSKANANDSSAYLPRVSSNSPTPPNPQYYAPTTGPSSSYATSQPYGDMAEPLPSIEDTNQSALRSSPFQHPVGIIACSPNYENYSNNLQNMANMTAAQITEYYAGMAGPQPLPYGQNMPILSPLAPSFQPFGGGVRLSPYSAPFQPSHITPVNSSPALQSRVYSTRNSPSPRTPTQRKARSTRSPTIQYRSHPRAKPEPTQQYLRQSQMPIESSNFSKPLLLIIDLNGTILFRPSKKQPSNFVERPFTNGFLTYAFNNHKVMIWSSARPQNVSNMCAKLFTDKRRKNLVAEWSREHLDLTEREYNDKIQVYKRLERVWANSKIQATFPKYSHRSTSSTIEPQNKWDQSNTVLIDDTLEKARGQPHNLIELPEFKGENVESDTVLAVLIDYLEILRRQVDVSSYIRRFPFDYEALKAKYSAVGQNTRQKDAVSAEDSDEYDPESFDPTAEEKNIDVLSQASDEYDPESFDPTSKETGTAIFSEDVDARSQSSDESYDPESFDPTSQEPEDAINEKGKGKEESGQLWTAINNEQHTEDLTRRLSESMDKAMPQPAIVSNNSEKSDSDDGGVRLTSSFDQSQDSGYGSRLPSQ